MCCVHVAEEIDGMLVEFYDLKESINRNWIPGLLIQIWGAWQPRLDGEAILHPCLIHDSE